MELSSREFLIAPIFVLIFYIAAAIYKSTIPANHSIHKYYYLGFTTKLFGATALGLIYYFYYGYGDTIYYFYRATRITDVFNINPGQALRVIFMPTLEKGSANYGLLVSLRAFDTASLMVTRVAAILSIISSKSYFATAYFFAFLSFIGSVSLYKLFVKIEPMLNRFAAFAVFFVPSIVFWGSGLLKDSLSFASLGILTYAAYQIIFERQYKPKYFIALLIFGFLLFTVKTYIVYVLVMSLGLWVFMHYQDKWFKGAEKLILAPILGAVVLGISYLLINQISSSSTYWSLDQLQDRAQNMQWWHTTVVDIYGAEGGGGSHYSLGNTDFSTFGIITKAPIAIITGLFRPFIWEAGSLVVLISALENLVLIFFTFRAFLKAGIFKSINIIKNKHALLFLFAFSLIFAFGVGFTSYNFGALVRYRIPLLPFFVFGLAYLEYASIKSRNFTRIAFAQ